MLAKSNSQEMPGDLVYYIEAFLKSLKEERGCAYSTIKARRVSLIHFRKWAYSQGLFLVGQIAKENIKAFEFHLFNYKKTNSESLSFSTQRQRVSSVRTFFKWLLNQNHILYNPALELEYPRKENILPKPILTQAEAKKILAQPKTSGTYSAYGIRDRAILEVLYSCGLRRGELLKLCVFDIDFNRKALAVRKGKNQKDRVLPLGDRALYWLERYLQEARPLLSAGKDPQELFVAKNGLAMSYPQPGDIVRRYMQKAGLRVLGGTHIFRHTMATHMLENGADIRHVGQMLGHSRLATTQVYTRVAISKLKEVHERTFEFAYQKPGFVLEEEVTPKEKIKKAFKPKIKDYKKIVLNTTSSFLVAAQKYIKEYLDYLEIKNYSQITIKNKNTYLTKFLYWLGSQNITSIQEVTRQTLQAYQNHIGALLHKGRPLSVASRLYMISEVALFFRWLSKQDYIVINPAANLSMPKRVKSLPMEILSQEEVEKIFAMPDLKTPAGLRDRAILELFYSTGMRLKELCHLKIEDVDLKQGSIFIKGSKGQKERYVPAGLRAIFWIKEYLQKARPHLAQSPDVEYIFLNRFGTRHSEGLSHRVKEYMEKAGIKKNGSTMIFRHSMATHMIDNDADLRYVQSILGHGYMEATKIYTHVAIGKLREIHAKTHPAEKRFLKEEH